MSWTAVIPFKGRAQHKTRLSVVMPADVRRMFAQCCLLHVATILRSAGIGRIVLLCDEPPPCWVGEVAVDRGGGLNAELAALVAALGPVPLVVVHADLPLLDAAEIELLIDAARHGIAIAADRHGSGTNAIAFAAAGPFPFAFGSDSLLRHLAAAGERGRLVSALGLGFDVDTPCDMADLLAMAPGQLRATSASMKGRPDRLEAPFTSKGPPWQR